MPFIEGLCENVTAPTVLSWTTASISMVLCVLTVPGNLMICLIIIRDPYRELKTPFNYFVLNLSAADLLIGTVTEPAFIVYHIREALAYPVMQNIWIVHLTYFVSCSASLLSFSALTIDRYLTAVSMHKRSLTTRRVFLISVFIWIVAFSLPVLYFFTGFYMCAFIFANTAVIATFTIVVFSYIRIYWKLRCQVRRWGTLQHTHVQMKAIHLERLLTKAFLLILGFFVICYAPACAMIYVINFCNASCNCELIHWFRDAQFLLTLLNCSLNQFLYAFRMPDFRRAFWKLIKCSKSYRYDINWQNVAEPNSPVAVNGGSFKVVEELQLYNLGHVNESFGKFESLESKERFGQLDC